MTGPMLNNFLASFKGADRSPLYGKPLVYLIGAPTARAMPGSVVEGPAGCHIAGTDYRIAYGNLAADDLTAQFTEAATLDYRFMELDNPAAVSVGTMMSGFTTAHGYGLAIIAKNPLRTKAAPQIITHNNVAGIIVERGAGSPAEYDVLRRRARKDGCLPIWFVFAGRTGADECAAAIKAGKFKGMAVTYSTTAYEDSHTILLPTG